MNAFSINSASPGRTRINLKNEPYCVGARHAASRFDSFRIAMQVIKKTATKNNFWIYFILNVLQKRKEGQQIKLKNSQLTSKLCEIKLTNRSIIHRL